MPSEFTCEGKRTSPPLTWSNPPTGTKFFAITMHHLPGNEEKHVYFVLYNIPAIIKSLPENTKDIGVFGINTVNGQQEYTPPCSKGPGAKWYTITVYALSSEMKSSVPASSVTMDVLLAAIKDKTLATSTMDVSYTRTEKDSAKSEAPSDHPGARIPPELERAITGLTLSDTEKQKVNSIIQNYQEKQRQLRDDLLQQLKGSLSPEQFTKIEAALKQPPPPQI